MTNAVYPKAREQFLQAGINLSSANIKVGLVDAAEYTYNAADEFLDDIPGGGLIASSGNLGSKTFTGGVFDSANPTVSGVTGDQFEQVVLYVDTGTPATSRLLAFYDTGVTGLPATPDGGDFLVTVNASGWFAI